ncbi:hypothetical protein Halar_0515 (plasmid) [halophilic archaeon DL31]|jgi:hypothetical protein|nr:hypothetical protein Halar_0515 [halophilic archaeon DL31]
MSDSSDSSSLPSDFFERLTEKQRGMIRVLLDAGGEWVRGREIRERMRNDYGIDIGEDGNPTAGVMGGLSRKYGKGFRRDVIEGRWGDDARQYTEHRIGDKYREELESRLG